MSLYYLFQVPPAEKNGEVKNQPPGDQVPASGGPPEQTDGQKPQQNGPPQHQGKLD